MKLEYPKDYNSTRFGNIRGYLKVDEARFIAEESLKLNNYIDREILIDILLLETLTDYEMPEDGEVEYDLLKHSGFIDEVKNTKGVNIIYEYIRDYESVERQLERTLLKANLALDTFVEKMPDSKGLQKIINTTLKKIEKIKGAQ
ncbi:MAG: hypothetical protein ACRCTZ_21100 [Sarcina sp.]